MALLRAVAYGWRQERLTEHAELAGRLGKDLFERMAVLAEHLSDVGRHWGKVSRRSIKPWAPWKRECYRQRGDSKSLGSDLTRK